MSKAIGKVSCRSAISTNFHNNLVQSPLAASAAATTSVWHRSPLPPPSPLGSTAFPADLVDTGFATGGFSCDCAASRLFPMNPTTWWPLRLRWPRRPVSCVASLVGPGSPTHRSPTGQERCSVFTASCSPTAGLCISFPCCRRPRPAAIKLATPHLTCSCCEQRKKGKTMIEAYIRAPCAWERDRDWEITDLTCGPKSFSELSHDLFSPL